MDSVLDFLFLRRLKFEYTSPPICPITPASASGLGVTGQVISPLLSMPPLSGGGLFNNFLTWQCSAGQICYNLYIEISGTLVEIASCLSSGSLTVCSGGTWKIVSDTGATSDPIITDGTQLVSIPLPTGTTFTVYKNGISVFTGSFCGSAEICQSGCYSITAITGDGETPPSNPACFVLGSLFPYDTFEEYSQNATLSGQNQGVNGSSPIAIWNPTHSYVSVDTAPSLLAWDTFETYANGSALGGQNGGNGAWSDSYVVV